MEFCGWRRSKCNVFFLDLPMQSSYTKISNFSDNFMSLNKKRNFDTLRLATFMTIWCFWSSDVIFTLSYTSFLTILWPEQDTHFFIGRILHIFRLSYEKMDSTNRRSMLSLARNNKNLKIDLHKNSAMATRSQVNEWTLW